MQKPVIYNVSNLKRLIPTLKKQTEEFEYFSQDPEISEDWRVLLTKASENTKRQIEIYREIVKLSAE